MIRPALPLPSGTALPGFFLSLSSSIERLLVACKFRQTKWWQLTANELRQ